MRAVWTVAAREIGAFFYSSIAYVLLTVWLLYQGFGLYLVVEAMARSSIGPRDVTVTPLTYVFGGGGNVLFYLPLLAIAPAVTMRLLAEERRSGSLELLLTAPVSDVAVVLGKYLAAVAIWCILWAPTVLYAVILGYYGDIDWGTVGSSYVGVFGVGAYYMAIGVLMSSVSRSQVVAAALTFLVLVLLFLVGIGGEYVFQEQQELFGYMSITTHMDSFAKGTVDSRYVLFDLSLAALALFLTVRVLDARRYEG